MLELKLPVASRGSRHTSRTPQGRSLKPHGNAALVDRRSSINQGVKASVQSPLADRGVRGDRFVFSPGETVDESPEQVRPAGYGTRRGPVPSSAAARIISSPTLPFSGIRPNAAPRLVMPARTSARVATPTFADRLIRSEARLVAAAVASTSVCCFLLVGYLAAYANVTRLSIEQAHVARDLKQASQQNQLLHAQLAAARSASYIAVAAQHQGMVVAEGRACYLSAQSASAAGFAGAPGAATQRSTGYQVASNGTGTGEQPANFGH